MTPPLAVRRLGQQPYADILAHMRAFTDARGADTPDEVWLLEHDPVFTQGQAGRAEHLLDPGSIPVVASDRGGQVTYHAPGQLVAYTLVDLPRRGLGVRALVRALEGAMIDAAAAFGIAAFAREDAPGVYVERALDGRPVPCKLGSLGLRVRRGCAYHGLALNVAMDLTPFERIHPCGFADLRMTQLAELGGPQEVAPVADALESALRRWLQGSR